MVPVQLGFSFFPLPFSPLLLLYRQVWFCCYYYNDEIRFNYGQPQTKENCNKSIKKDGQEREVGLCSPLYDTMLTESCYFLFIKYPNFFWRKNLQCLPLTDTLKKLCQSKLIMTIIILNVIIVGWLNNYKLIVIYLIYIFIFIL